jgi:dihydroorotate dehydrogenase (fumarate)
MSHDPGVPSASTDLTTRYLGLELANPVVASASPLTGSIESLLALEAAGIAAVVLPSLFEEQVEHDSAAFDHLAWGPESSAEAHGGWFPALDDYNTGPEEYLDLLIAAKRMLQIPVIASLNGSSDGGWVHYAAALQDEGADALELNIYHVAADPDLASVEVEDGYLRLVEHVRGSIDIPLAVKIGPFFSSPANMARRLSAAGAEALVLFNRFYQPDIDLDRLEVVPSVVLSAPAEMRLVLRWIAILRGRVDAQLAATTGAHDAAAVTKLVLAGADAVMMASALLRHGPELVPTIVSELQRWFSERGYTSLDQARGSASQERVPDPSAFERANYMQALVSYGR